MVGYSMFVRLQDSANFVPPIKHPFINDNNVLDLSKRPMYPLDLMKSLCCSSRTAKKSWQDLFASCGLKVNPWMKDQFLFSTSSRMSSHSTRKRVIHWRLVINPSP